MRHLIALLFFISFTSLAQPVSFEQAKTLSRNHVYHDRNDLGDAYCGCPWSWAGRSGGIVNIDVCGYQIRAQENRAKRIEWEHIVPASNFGRARQCWQDGGRKNCTANDPVFSLMEADLHNLTPVVGEVNADRSNFNFGQVANATPLHGACPFRVDFKNRIAEPPDPVKGMVARVYFYMADRYNLNLSRQQERLFMIWNANFPVTPWEIERDRRIHGIMGHSNPFVTGSRTWHEGYRPTGWGLVSTTPTTPTASPSQAMHPHPQTISNQQMMPPPVIGNKNSKIYHLINVCPNYKDVSPQNAIAFSSEQEAISHGFRKAGNCR